jgi:hypothetical protein
MDVYISTRKSIHNFDLVMKMHDKLFEKAETYAQLKEVLKFAKLYEDKAFVKRTEEKLHEIGGFLGLKYYWKSFLNVFSFQDSDGKVRQV